MKQFKDVIDMLLTQILEGNIKKAEGDFEKDGQTYKFTIYNVGDKVIRFDIKK